MSTSDSDSSPHTSAVVVDNPLGRDSTKNGWTDPEMSLKIVTKEIGTQDRTYPAEFMAILGRYLDPFSTFETLYCRIFIKVRVHTRWIEVSGIQGSVSVQCI